MTNALAFPKKFKKNCKKNPKKKKGKKKKEKRKKKKEHVILASFLAKPSWAGLE